MDAYVASRSAAAADWDASTAAGDERTAKMERAGRAREAAELLKENPELRSVHSPASVLAMLGRTEAALTAGAQ